MKSDFPAVRLAGMMVLAIILLMVSGSYASEPMPFEKLNAACSLYVIGNPESGEPFEAVFEFTPRQDIWHEKNIPDTARIRPSGDIKFISGDTLWTGYLELNRTFKMTCVFRMIGKEFSILNATICAREAVFPDINPKLPNVGKKACTGTGIHFNRSQGPANVIFKRRWEEDKSTGFIPEDTIPVSKLLPGIIAEPMRSGNHIGAVTCDGIGNNFRTVDTNYIFIKKLIEFREKGVWIESRRVNLIIIDGGTGKISFPEQPGLLFQQLTPTSIKLIINGTVDSLYFELNNKSYALPIISSDESFYIQGYASYLNNNSDIIPCRAVSVGLWEYNYNLEIWE